ncbi:glycosyltransferase [Tamlana sp. 2201CG12-4]|uniref:glycosyltransferase family 2 protein n=1 Tax=Tamlana sp. 2201CG12-4 TaxID=3112582 RepID=UPI002DB757F9|nr:glycosyltransferase [Tamlana sp. 2201CG12-4]MEC3907250.1 glycosyltransferase [Tamlana sp. 2201CG12-4]
MLSILIPVYNCDISKLVNELYTQTVECNINFEILAYDDGSRSSTNSMNEEVNNIKNCTFKALQKNIGRSAVRNLLGFHSKFENLLFIDAGTFPRMKSFIKNYIAQIETSQVLVGGMTFCDEPPEKPFKLRWIYTKKRESKSGLHSCNFYIKKNLFKDFSFDESLKNYGYEDVLFFETLKTNGIMVKTFYNPVEHYADDTANTFIKKNENAIKNLINLINKGKLNKDKVGISKCYFKLSKFKLCGFIVSIFKLTKPILKYNLNSNYPLLFLYDFYRLGYFCLIKNKK